MVRLEQSIPSLLLVEMPFKTVDRPSIGLSLLRASAIRAGYSCEVLYANLPFARRIGFDLYRTIAEDLPPESLFGDRVFSSRVVGRRLGEDEGLAGVPSRLRALLPSLRRE